MAQRKCDQPDALAEYFSIHRCSFYPCHQATYKGFLLPSMVRLLYGFIIPAGSTISIFRLVSFSN